MVNALSRNAGSTKWRLHWGSFRGSSLNLKWSKCGVWWVDRWVPISWLHIESSRYHWMHAWVFVFTWNIDMLIMTLVYLDWGFWLWRFFFLVLHYYYLFGDIDMLIILIVHFTLLSIVTLILPCLFWLTHMYRLTIVYHSIRHDWFSQLYIILFIMELAIIVRYSYQLACV